MINEQGNGDLKMVDLCSFDKSLKTTWVTWVTWTRLIMGNGGENTVFNFVLKEFHFRAPLSVGMRKRSIALLMFIDLYVVCHHG